MKLVENIKAILLGDTSKTTPPQRTKRLSHDIKRNYQYRVELNLNEFKVAIDSAEMQGYYNRKLLYQIYEQILKDSHLASQIRTAKAKVINQEILISKYGEKDIESTALLETPWFNDFVDLAMDVEYWGHSLIEFGRLNDKGRFDKVELIPRLNVRQEHGVIVDDYDSEKGIDYRTHATRFALLEFGDPYDLGLLELAAKEVIVKNYARTDWSQASEKYGMPLLKILTESQDYNEIDKMEAMAANFGSNGYVILNKNDDAEIIQADRKFSKIYQEHISLCDSQISKLINGQASTSDEKSYKGAAGVHERLLGRYTKARLRSIQHLVNGRLIPFLIAWGYPLSGCRFSYQALASNRAHRTFIKFGDS